MQIGWIWLVESLRKEGDNSANAIKDRFFESMRKIVGSSEVDTKAFHDRLDLLSVGEGLCVRDVDAGAT